MFVKSLRHLAGENWKKGIKRKSLLQTKLRAVVHLSNRFCTYIGEPWVEEGKVIVSGHNICPFITERSVQFLTVFIQTVTDEQLRVDCEFIIGFTLIHISYPNTSTHFTSHFCKIWQPNRSEILSPFTLLQQVATFPLQILFFLKAGFPFHCLSTQFT